LFTLTFLFNDHAWALNLGHRAAGGKSGSFPMLPENSLRALKAVTVGGQNAPGRKERVALQFEEAFDYLEFDVQETADGELVVFHDSKLKRLIPNNGDNRKTYTDIARELEQDTQALAILSPAGYEWKDLKIRQLTLAQLKRFHLGMDIQDRIPTLQEFLQACLEWGLERPIALEIKSIYSDRARQKLIDTYADFKVAYLARTKVSFSRKYDMAPDGVSIIAFPSNFKKSFGKNKDVRRQWCAKMKDAGFEKVHRTLFHGRNLCNI
jgi:glycerophosphoryl diester phosphodiesterase